MNLLSSAQAAVLAASFTDLIFRGYVSRFREQKNKCSARTVSSRISFVLSELRGQTKVAQDSGTHDSKTEEAEKVKIFDDQFLCSSSQLDFHPSFTW